jgi:tRNA(Ile)-lysidine synthase
MRIERRFTKAGDDAYASLAFTTTNSEIRNPDGSVGTKNILGISSSVQCVKGTMEYAVKRIRAELLPVWEALFPSFRQTLARSASHAAQAQTLLEEVAAQDLVQVGQPPVLAALQLLSTARQANVLRHWLKGLGVRASQAQLQALMQQVQACTTRGHRIHLKVGEGFVHRVEDCIDWYNP